MENVQVGIDKRDFILNRVQRICSRIRPLQNGDAAGGRPSKITRRQRREDDGLAESLYILRLPTTPTTS
jgi:hypothetical protein